LPWTPLALYALARAWQQARAPRSQGLTRRGAWRFALCAALPGLVVLSLAATARGIYAAPCMPGFALLTVLAWRESCAPHGDAQQGGLPQSAPAAAGLLLALRLSAVLVWAVALLLIGCTLYLTRTAASVGGFVTMASLIGGVLALWIARRPLLPRLLLAWCLVLGLAAWAPFVALNRTQDLNRLAARLLHHADAHPLLLWQPDETTQALAMLYLPPGRWRVLDVARAPGQTPAGLLVQALAATPDARVVALAPRSGWSFARWRAWLADGALPDTPPPGPAAGIDPLLAGTGLVPQALLERPGGRGYLMWAAPGATAVRD
jgi:hypothetical protein